MSAIERFFPCVLAAPAETREQSTGQRIRAASLRAREALARSAELSGAVLGALEQGEDEAPLPSNGWWWSLAHDLELAGGLVSRSSVGFDLERVRPLRAELVAGFLNERERGLLDPLDPLALARAWTAKEAVLKRAGVGLAELSQCRVIGPLTPDRIWLEHRGERCLVMQTRHQDHVLAVHSPGERWEVVWPSVRPAYGIEARV